jgi:hypothetical protein
MPSRPPALARPGPDPLDRLLADAASRATDPAVRQWLQALAGGGRASSGQPAAGRVPAEASAAVRVENPGRAGGAEVTT